MTHATSPHWVSLVLSPFLVVGEKAKDPCAKECGNRAGFGSRSKCVTEKGVFPFVYLPKKIRFNKTSRLLLHKATAFKRRSEDLTSFDSH